MANLDRIDMEELTVLKLTGSLNAQGLGEVEAPFETATAKPGARVVVDLAGVDIVTTPALSMFLAAADSLKRSGGRIIFTQSQPPVRDILHRLKLQAVLRTVGSLDEAISQARQSK